MDSLNFESRIKEHPYHHHWFVKFYAPWCSISKHLAPVWEEFATDWSNAVNIAEVNCTEQWDLCKKYKIDSYPTILFFAVEDPPGEYYSYHGPRTV